MEHYRRYLKEVNQCWNYITPTEFYDDYVKKRRKYTLIDLRHPKDYKKGHIKGAKNIYWLNILDENNLKKLPKNKRIFVICYVGHSSSQVMVLLRLLGYEVTSIKFGMGTSPVTGVPVAGWTDYGYPTKK